MLNENYKFGISILNSEFKYRSYTISAFVYQQVCTNGLTILRSHITEKIRHNKNTEAFENAVKSAFSKFLGNLDKMWQQYAKPLEIHTEPLCIDWQEFVEINFLK